MDAGGFALSEVGTGNRDTLWMRGGFPRAVLAPSAAAWARWMGSFTRTFLERDIPMLSPRASPEAIGRFWRMIAHCHGQIWNASALAHSMDVSAAAVNRFRDLLSGAFMVRILPPWLENPGKRLVKSPKVFLRDSGVLHCLLGLEESRDLPMHPRYGASWEGFRLEQTLLAHGQREAYFYRTRRGAELDLTLLRRRRRWGFEFNCTDAPRTTKSMHIAIADLRLEHLWGIYPGSLEHPLGERITALPLSGVRERALMAGLEMEAFRTYAAIADRACPHCHGRNDSRSMREVARFKGKSKTAWSPVENWLNLSSLEFTEQREGISTGKAPAGRARKH